MSFLSADSGAILEGRDMNTDEHECKQYNIHYCCYKCIFGCKKPYKHWSTNVPCIEFCRYFEKATPEDNNRLGRWKKHALR